MNELILRGLAAYYGMTLKEFASIINEDTDKLARFIHDFLYNHN